MGSSECRAAGDGSFHVAYRIDDDLRDAENLTHAESTPVDLGESDDSEASWLTQPDDESNGELIQVYMISNPDVGYDIEHRITPETAEQLSQMFLLAARGAREVIQARENREAAKRREDAEIAAQQGNLPL